MSKECRNLRVAEDRNASSTLEKSHARNVIKNSGKNLFGAKQINDHLCRLPISMPYQFMSLMRKQCVYRHITLALLRSMLGECQPMLRRNALAQSPIDDRVHWSPGDLLDHRATTEGLNDLSGVHGPTLVALCHVRKQNSWLVSMDTGHKSNPSN